MKKPLQNLSLCGLAMVIGAVTASAVPYASSVKRTGDTVSFVLNQAAAGVTVLRNGGNPAPGIGTTPGEYTFSMAGYTSYQIMVTGNTAKAWTQYVPDQTSTSFEYPFGVAVNKLPGSTDFGKVYVSSSRVGTTVFGRTSQDGIYVLRADGTDLGFTTGGRTWTGASAPYRSVVGPDGHLYVSDLSSDLVFEFNDDLSVATALIDSGNRTANQFVHGVYVEGTQATGDRKVYLVNGNGNDTARKGLIMYDLGANGTVGSGDTGAQVLGPTYYQSAYYPYDVARDSSGNWYLNAYRGILNQMPPITKFNGAGTWPLDDDVIWEADKATYYYAWSMDIDEKAGLAAYGSALDGTVFFFDMTTGAFISSFDAGGAVRELAFDAAGNLVTVDNSAEWARFWSPGGFTVATTAFDGSQSTFAVQELTVATEVTVAATVATADEQGPVNGVFTVTRTGSTTSPLIVNYTLAGTAVNGTDYSSLLESVTIPASSSSATITVAVEDDSIAELSETVILSISSGSGYGIGAAGSATVTIRDNETPEIGFSTTATNRLLESYAPSKVILQLQRKGLLTPSVTVNLASLGVATAGADFNAPMTVTLAANAATTNITLTPINDQMYEGNELAILAVASGTGYTAGAARGYAMVIDDDPSPGTVLFSDNFETDSSTLWKVNYADDFDAFVDFAWDYSAVGVPPAPGGGGTKGMRMRAGNTLLQINGLSASPLNLNLTGDYRLKFDMWINYNGPMPDGGPGSTQNFDAGVGTSGDVVVWLNNPNSDGVWFSATGDGADGATGGDYNALIGGAIQNDDTGFYAAGVGPANGGLRNNSHAYYSLWGGHAAPPAQLALYPNQTGVANIGNAGMAWHTVVITKQGPVVTWVIDGITIATVTNNGTMGNNVFVGYQDLFASGSLSDVPEMSFGLVDNLKVQTLIAPTAPVVTGIQLVNGGTQVKITFTAGAADAPAAFSVVGSSTLGGAFGDVQETITSPSAGQFEALTPVSGSSSFYRILRQ